MWPLRDAVLRALTYLKKIEAIVRAKAASSGRTPDEICVRRSLALVLCCRKQALERDECRPLFLYEVGCEKQKKI